MIYEKKNMKVLSYLGSVRQVPRSRVAGRGNPQPRVKYNNLERKNMMAADSDFYFDPSFLCSRTKTADNNKNHSFNRAV